MASSDSMTVIYVAQTNHILAAVQQVSAAPGDVVALTGPDGLVVGGVRGSLPATVGLTNFGTPATEKEQFVVPTSVLKTKELHSDLDVVQAPHAFMVDGTDAASIPPSDSLEVTLTQHEVVVHSTGLLSLIFPVDTNVFVQVEGPSPAARRVMRKTVPKATPSPFKFTLTVESGLQAPLAPTPGPTKTAYSILLLIEGRRPDARTAML